MNILSHKNGKLTGFKNLSVPVKLTYDVGCRIKLVPGARESGNEPRQCCTLLTILVLDKTPDLSIVGFSILFVNYRNNISNLVIDSLGEVEDNPIFKIKIGGGVKMVVWEDVELASPHN